MIMFRESQLHNDGVKMTELSHCHIQKTKTEEENGAFVSRRTLLSLS